jgi:hypothetical protein
MIEKALIDLPRIFFIIYKNLCGVQGTIRLWCLTAYHINLRLGEEQALLSWRGPRPEELLFQLGYRRER